MATDGVILMNKIVLVDAMNSIHISFNMAKRQIYEAKNERGEEAVFTESDVPFFLHMLFKKYNYYFSTYGKMIFCFEGFHSLDWRRSIFPDYKRNRDKAKAEDDYAILKKTFPMIEEILEMYPTKVLRVNEAEGDDIIFALTEKYSVDHEVTIISNDNDFSQILNLFDNVSIYNPITMKFVDRQPNILLEKAIIGDKSDGIPGLDRIGEKTFEKMMADKSFFNEKMKNGNKELVETFLKIVDLSKYPNEYKQKILDKEKNTEYNKFDPSGIEAFFFEHRLKELLTTWGKYVGDIELAIRE